MFFVSFRPFVAAMATPVSVLELFLSHNYRWSLDHGHRHCRPGKLRHGRHATWPECHLFCRNQLALLLNQLLVFDLDVEPSSTAGAVAEELDQIRSLRLWGGVIVFRDVPRCVSLLLDANGSWIDVQLGLFIGLN